MPSRKTLNRIKQREARDRPRTDRRKKMKDEERYHIAVRLLSAGALENVEETLSRVSDRFYNDTVSTLLSQKDSERLINLVRENQGASQDDLALRYLERIILVVLTTKYGFSPVDGAKTPTKAAEVMLSMFVKDDTIIETAKDLIADIDFDVNPFGTKGVR